MFSAPYRPNRNRFGWHKNRFCVSFFKNFDKKTIRISKKIQNIDKKFIVGRFGINILIFCPGENKIRNKYIKCVVFFGVIEL